MQKPRETLQYYHYYCIFSITSVIHCGVLLCSGVCKRLTECPCM